MMSTQFLAAVARGTSFAFLNVLLLGCFLGGVVAVAYGSWLIYEPAGFLVGGSLAVLIPILYARGAWLASSRP